MPNKPFEWTGRLWLTAFATRSSLPATQVQRSPYHRGLQRLPSKPKVVEFVLELELLQLAALTISYADLTISMESPNFDVAIQIANEQRGMAARVG